MTLPTDLETIGRIAIGVVPAIVTLIGLTRGPGSVRSRLRHDLELLDKIPADTEGRKTFQTYLDERIRQFTKYETEATRDVQGLVIGLILVAGLGVLALWLFSLDGWWWSIAAVATLIVAAAGLAASYDYALKVPRDENRKRL